MYIYILAFGSNLGDRERNYQRGRDYLVQFGEILRSSPSIYTEPLESPLIPTVENQNHFLNAIIEYRCPLGPQALYDKIVDIENELGHDRLHKWAPRHLDIDILQFAEDIPGQHFHRSRQLHWKQGTLCIPHPELQNRPFLLQLLENFHHVC